MPIKKILSGVVVLLLLACGFLYCQKHRTITVPVLMYHKFGSAGSDVWTMDLKEFRRDLASFSAQGYKTILPKDLAANKKWGRPLPSKPMIITMDDGHIGVTNAEVLLKEYGYKAIVYLITDMTASNDAARFSWNGAPCLIWDEVKAIESRGVLSFGGHSASHANLASLADPSEEIRRCFNDLRRNLGHKPDSFCYPFNQYNPRVVAAMTGSRFTTGMAGSDTVAVISAADDMFKIARVSVFGGDKSFRLSKVSEGVKPEKVLLHYKGPPMDVSVRIKADGFFLRMQFRKLAGDGAELLDTDLPAGIKELEVEVWDKHGIIHHYSGCLKLEASEIVK